MATAGLNRAVNTAVKELDEKQDIHTLIENGS